MLQLHAVISEKVCCIFTTKKYRFICQDDNWAFSQFKLDHAGVILGSLALTRRVLQIWVFKSSCMSIPLSFCPSFSLFGSFLVQNWSIIFFSETQHGVSIPCRVEHDRARCFGANLLWTKIT